MEAPRSGRHYVKIRTEMPLDSASRVLQKSDPGMTVREILLQICSKESLSVPKSQAVPLLTLLAKQLEGKDCKSLGVSLEDLLTCLRIPLVSDNKVLRTAGLRVIRLCVNDAEAVHLLIKTNIPHFIAKCLDVTLDNMAERAQALRLCRKILLVSPPSFPPALGHCVVALAIDGTREKDRLVRASFALLAELCVLNPAVFVASGGLRCFSSSILDCPSPRMQEAMMASLLYLLNTERRRRIAKLNLRFLVAPYSDFHYKHAIDMGETNNTSISNEDRELRLLCAKQAILSVLRSWPGLLHVVSCNIFHDLVKVLLPCHLETRKAMLELFYMLLRLPLPEWTDEFTVAMLATDPSRVQDSWKLQEGYVAAEGKTILPHVSKFRPNLVLNHTALLVYCLIESRLVQTLIEVIVTSDTFISVRATILLGELLHLSSTLLPPVCHGTKMCLPNLVDCITSLKSDPLKRHRAAQAAAALTKIHQLKKNGVSPHSLSLKQIVEMEKRLQKGTADRANVDERDKSEPNGPNDSETPKANGELDGESQLKPTVSSRDPDGTLLSLLRDCAVLVHKDPLLWNWQVLPDVFLWTKMNCSSVEDSPLRSVLRRLIQFYKPSSNQFCQCEFNHEKTRLYSTVGCFLMDFLTSFEEVEFDRLLSDFLKDLSSVIRNITLVPSAHDALLSPGRLSTTAYQDYFLFIGRLSGSVNGIAALERAGIFQDLLELVTDTNHDCYLKVVVSNLNYHTDGYARAILKKVLIGPVEAGRIYATNHLRVLLRAAVAENNSALLAKWAIPLLLNQLKDNCRTVVMTAADILHEATDDPSCIEVLVPLHPQFAQLIEAQEEQHLGLRGRLLLIKTLSIPSGFKLWNREVADAETNGEATQSASPLQKELDNWMNHFNVRYVQMVESDLADGLTHHQRADDGRYGRLSNARHAIRELPVPPHLLSQLNQHREGLDFLRMSGQLSRIFAKVTSCSAETEDQVLQLKSAMWAAGHLGTSEAGVSLLQSALVVDALVRIAAQSSVLALRGTAYFALNLIATTSAGVDLLSRFGWASIKRHHGELWHVIDDSEWTCLREQSGAAIVEGADVVRERIRSTSQSSTYSVTFARGYVNEHALKGIVTSTPIRSAVNCNAVPSTSWDTESQPYSLEGSSIHFDSDSDYGVGSGQEPDGEDISERTDATDRCRRAYTLPPTIHPGPEHVAHFRSFSDSHYPAPEEAVVASSVPDPRRTRLDSRIWNMLRSSFRLRRSKRFSLPSRKRDAPPSTSTSSAPVQMVHYEPSKRESVSAPTAAFEEDSSSDEDPLPSPVQPDLPRSRMGSVLSQTKTASHRRRLHSRSIKTQPGTPCYIGLCLPVQLSSLCPSEEFFDPSVDFSQSSDMTYVNDDSQFDHESQHCIACPTKKTPRSESRSPTADERLLVRKELMRLVFNMGSSVGLNANEQGLLRLKQRFPWAFHDICIFSDVCHVLANYGYRLRARRFLHELFMDSPFHELFAEAVARLKDEPVIGSTENG